MCFSKSSNCIRFMESSNFHTVWKHTCANKFHIELKIVLLPTHIEGVPGISLKWSLINHLILLTNTRLSYYWSSPVWTETTLSYKSLEFVDKFEVYLHCASPSLLPNFLTTLNSFCCKKEQNFINKDGTKAFVFLGSVVDSWKICYNNITLLRTLI